MPSRTTLWRYRTGKGKSTLGHVETRGGKTAEERLKMLQFVGAVVAQLLSKGSATESGLKIFPSIRDRNRDKGPVGWIEPPHRVWQALGNSGFNPGCLAIAAAGLGQLVKHVRPASRSATTHVDSAPRRDSSKRRDCYWNVVPGMSRKTVWYWRKTRHADFEKAGLWLLSLLKKEGFKTIWDPDQAMAAGTQQRDDISRLLDGKVLKINRYGSDYMPEAPHYSLHRGRHKLGPKKPLRAE